jgi:hypothetical protein
MASAPPRPEMRFRPLAWPLELFRHGVSHVDRMGLWGKLGSYPFRLARYWFAAAELENECARVGRALTVVDLGCERGITREFCRDLSGAYLLRWMRNPLENLGWWVRANQFWGSVFPSLGGEVFVLSRKDSANGADAPSCAPHSALWPPR